MILYETDKKNFSEKQNTCLLLKMFWYTWYLSLAVFLIRDLSVTVNNCNIDILYSI